MKKRYREVQVPLVSLRLDLQNARHPALQNQREVYEWMLGGKARIGQKLFNLAIDIVEYGQSPIDRILIMKSKDDGWDVYEGNRRVCVLQLLNNPDIAPTAYWVNRFRKLKKQYKYSAPQKIECIEALDEEFAYHLIELRHQGEREGVGIISWGAEEKARHDIKRDKKSRHFRSLLVLDYVKNSPNFSPEIKQYAGSGFPITTLDRLLSDKDVREFLGFRYKRGSDSLEFGIDPIEANKAIAKVIEGLGSKSIKVDDVKTKEDRKGYIKKFPKENRPDHSKLLDTEKPIESVVGVDVTKPGKGKKKARKKIERKQRRSRTTLIPPGTIWEHKLKRADDIFNELRTLNVRRQKDDDSVYLNAVALLLRAYLELSVTQYLLHESVPCKNPKGWDSGDVNLSTKLSEAKKTASAQKIIDAHADQAIQKVISDKDHAANPNTLNHYVHNRKAALDPDRLMQVWDLYSDLMEAIWGVCK